MNNPESNPVVVDEKAIETAIFVVDRQSANTADAVRHLFAEYKRLKEKNEKAGVIILSLECQFKERQSVVEAAKKLAHRHDCAVAVNFRHGCTCELHEIDAAIEALSTPELKDAPKCKMGEL